MKKTRLKVNSNKVLFSVYFLAFVSLFPWVLLIMFDISENDSLVAIVCFYTVLSLCSFFLFWRAIYMMQYAELSDQGIVIRSLFSTIKEIKWNELVDFRTESVATFSSAYGYRYFNDWIVLYTDSSQKEKERVPYNRKKSGPWYIAVTRNNLTVFEDYAKKYASHIWSDPDSFF